MTPLQEVEVLKVGLSRALAELRKFRPRKITDVVIQLRFDTAIALLAIMRNDVINLEKSMEEQCNSTD